MKIRFWLNGIPAEREVRPDETLLETLRGMGIHSVRTGCETGNCGICTVWADETPVLSCAYPAARAEGRRITTVEGVREEAAPLMEALAAEGADQCGYCAPGFLMTVLAMLRDESVRTQAEAEAYLAGCLCRCTGYQSRMRAILKVMDETRRDR